MSLTLFDNAHWLFAQPVKPAPGTVLDFSGTRLEATFTSMFGGSAEPVVVVSSDAADGQGKVTFVPASGNVGPYFLFDVPVTARNWRASLAQTVYADVLRAPDPSKPDDKFVLGRVEAKIYPGTGSAGIANPSQFPVLYPTQPYGGLPLSAAMLIGPQGEPGAGGGLPPLPPDADTVNYTLGLVGGALAWVVAGNVAPTPDPGTTTGVLDFSDPANSGLLAAFLLAQPAAPATGAGVLDFSDPANSGLLPAFMLAAA
jgi:mRNA-degrading endonuclease toxin of MazEF toxin-antitoxin module